MAKPRKLLTGDDTPWGYDAYNQAVTEGLVDPKKVSLKYFMEKYSSRHEVYLKRSDLNADILREWLIEAMNATKGLGEKKA
jgi:hypothetical protein